MKVEVRQRIGIRPVGAVSAAASKRPGSPNFSVVEAYQDSCFESPTRFFTVAPEHPKLGKWAKPSTLKYIQAPQTAALVAANCCLDEAAVSAATLRSRQPQTACSSPVASRGCHDRGGGRGEGEGSRVAPSSPTRSADSGGGGSGGGGGGGRGGGGGDGDGKCCYDKGPRHKMVGSNKTSVVADGGGGGGGGGAAAAVREDGKRPVSPAGALRWGSESPPPSPHWGRREAPRINTPVSGRVAPLHQRGFQASFRPSSPTLRGSFDNLQKRHNKMSTSCTAKHFPQNCTWLPTVQREETESDTTQHHNHHHHHDHQRAREGFPVLGVEEVGIDLKTVALRSDYEAEEEVDPDVRYRVRFTDASRGPSAEGDTTLQSPPVHAVVLPSASPTPAPRPDVYTSPLQPKIRQRVGDSSRGERAPAPPAAAAAAAAADEATRDEALVDQWVSSEVDPFLSAVRRGLLRDRPVDISAYVSNFCNVWRGGGNTEHGSTGA